MKNLNDVSSLLSTVELSSLSRKQKLEALALLEEAQRRKARNKIATLYPDEGEFRRELYVGHLEFFKLGATYSERALFGGNRTGKTLAGCYEMTCHLTGNYPSWWDGWRVPNHAEYWC